jgi:hypothetical protein
MLNDKYLFYYLNHLFKFIVFLSVNSDNRFLTILFNYRKKMSQMSYLVKVFLSYLNKISLIILNNDPIFL